MRARICATIQPTVRPIAEPPSMAPVKVATPVDGLVHYRCCSSALACRRSAMSRPSVNHPCPLALLLPEASQCRRRAQLLVRLRQPP